jgi:hypothetical protein
MTQVEAEESAKRPSRQVPLKHLRIRKIQADRTANRLFRSLCQILQHYQLQQISRMLAGQQGFHSRRSNSQISMREMKGRV